MKFNLLQSGSSGNCSLIQSNKTKILIDCGISFKQIKERLSILDTSIDEIKAILITHEHIDHIKSIDYMKNELIYASKDTLRMPRINIIDSFKFYELNDLKFMAIPTSHDVNNPVGYIIADEEVLVYLTDTGLVYEEEYPYIND